MLNKSIKIQNFSSIKKNKKNKKFFLRLLRNLIKSDNEIISSMKKTYRDSYNNKLILNLKKFKNINLIGMGGSVLGAKAIYHFLNTKKTMGFAIRRASGALPDDGPGEL